MTAKGLNKEYFEWMYQLISHKPHNRRSSYRRLIYHLHDIDFHHILPMDANRANDGIDLRYRFGYERKYERTIISTYLGNRPCTVLEMILALAIRCEEDIMADPDIGDRTILWFWTMIDNLGLGSMDDMNFDESYTDDVIFRFMNRQYHRNGEGGLFIVENYKYDMRTVEIWWQMNWYLDSIIT